MSARKLETFLHEPNSPLSRLTAAAQRLSELAQIWESIAPIGLARYSRVGRIDNGVVTLYTDNGAIASKLNQQLPSLLTKFQQRGGEITGILVDVQVNQPSSKPVTTQKNPISYSGLSCLTQLERELPVSALKEALTNLIRHQIGSNQDQTTDRNRQADDQ